MSSDLRDENDACHRICVRRRKASFSRMKFFDDASLRPRAHFRTWISCAGENEGFRGTQAYERECALPYFRYFFTRSRI